MVGGTPQAFDRLAAQERLAEVSEMLLTGYSQVEIAAAFGVTRATIGKVVLALEREWIVRRHEAVDTHMGRQLAKLDRLEAEYWEGWRRSQTERAVKSSRQVKRNGGRSTIDANGNVSAITPTELTEASLRSETNLGNPAFLAGIERCIQERNRILGLYAPEKIDANISFTLDQAYEAAAPTIELHRTEREEWLAGEGRATALVEGDIDEAMRTDDLSDPEDLLAPPPDVLGRSEIDAAAALGGEAVSTPDDDAQVA